MSRPALILALALLAACGDPPAASSVPSGSEADGSLTPGAHGSQSPHGPEAVLVAAGDIASCDHETDSDTAALIAARADATVATLGDNVYPSGTDATYAKCYAPTWGAFLDRTYPALGIHDIEADGGAAYFRYFGDRAGASGSGWYSYELGAWHVIVLNSSCASAGCEPDSPQLDWLAEDLAASDADCTLAYWHHPRFSSGPHGGASAVAPFWDVLASSGADVVLAGHDHLYERFAPQSPAGVADPDGIRQFTVGTGGRSLYEREQTATNSEVIIDDAFGILELGLHSNAYDWRFVTVDGAVADMGSDACH